MTMRISQDTMQILKHAATINGGLVIEPGNTILTKNEANSVIMHVEVSEIFDKKFCTVDLQKFLAIASLFEDPEFDFEDEYVLISSQSGNMQTKFYQSNESLVRSFCSVPKERDDVALEFNLSKEDLQKVFKSAGVMGFSDILFSSKNGKITMSSLDKKVQTTSRFDVVIGECDPEEEEKQFFFKKGNLKLTDNNFKVVIYKAGLGVFKAVDSPHKHLAVYVVTEVDTSK